MNTVLETKLILPRGKIVARLLLDNIVWIILVLCVVAFSSSIPGYFRLINYINILTNATFIGILAIAEAYCLISGNLDLSIESVAGFSAILAAWLSARSLGSSGLNLNPYLTLVLCLLAGITVGYINSFFILRFKINSFLVTLSTYIIVRGLAISLTGGLGLSQIPASFRLVHTIQFFNISLIPIIMVILYVFFYFLLVDTRFGKHIFIIGGNIGAAYNFGVNVNRIVTSVFMLSGLLAALSGWLMTAKANGASPTMANGYLFETLAAIVLGGVSLQGGIGSLTGVFAGVLVLSSIRSALNIMSVSPFITEVIRGCLVLFAILIDSIKRKFYK
ncbi:MAG: ABC transporter permease [candidate division WOR-3 bacterium]|nr:MAG: ABC transporter permease [candidate division WOR-3 bacterium]